MSDDQTKGRTRNGATPVDSSTPDASSKDAEKTGRIERTTAGPDGPDATEVGDTFKQRT